MTPPAEVETTPYEAATEAAEEAAALIRRFRHVYSDEEGLPARIAAMFQAAEVDYVRARDPQDRVDLITGRVGVEVVTGGTVGEVHRRLTGHADSEDLDAFVLVTTRRRYRALPPDAGGKPVVVVWLTPDFPGIGG